MSQLRRPPERVGSLHSQLSGLRRRFQAQARRYEAFGANSCQCCHIELTMVIWDISRRLTAESAVAEARRRHQQALKRICLILRQHRCRKDTFPDGCILLLVEHAANAILYSAHLDCKRFFASKKTQLTQLTSPFPGHGTDTVPLSGHPT